MLSRACYLARHSVFSRNVLRYSTTIAIPKKDKVPKKEFVYQPLFATETGDTTPYRLITKEGVEKITVTLPDNSKQEVLRVSSNALRQLSREAIHDISHLLRPGHLQQLRNILDDSEASQNDKFVALQLLKNANIASAKILPSCQDTGTVIILGKRGQYVWTDGNDEQHLSHGVYDTFTETSLRYSQVAPLDFFREQNTGTNLPAQIDLMVASGNKASYHFLFMTKGGGSANKTFLFQENKSLLNPESLAKFIKEKIKSLGTSACPPYHLALVVGGLSAELTLKTVKLASARYYDNIFTSGNTDGRAFRDLQLEKQVLEACQKSGIGAQFGGKYFCHDVRVIRLPRHGASCPVGLGVSCSADRQALAKIDASGIWLEQLEENPVKYLPEVSERDLSPDVVKIDLTRPMSEILSQLLKHPVRTRLSLTGPLIVARDIAHAKLKERLDSGAGLPDYVKNHIIYYAGPAKTPEGYASGSFGPTTAGRMDSYVDLFQVHGGSMISLAKGNRSRQVTSACKRNGGFYLGSIGGPAAVLAQDNIRSVSVLEYPELGMEAIFKVHVEDFPAFICIDNKGEDFFAEWL